MSTDWTHDPDLKSWVESADSHSEFPVQNLPFCSFERRAGQSGEKSDSRIGVGIGDQVFDLSQAAELFPTTWRDDLKAEKLNGVMGWGLSQRIELRHRLAELLSTKSDDLRENGPLRDASLISQDSVQFGVPCFIRDYTDFYASVYHATNVGSMFRPDNPLLPNYKHIPIGYHGRASSIVASETDVRRPVGQLSPLAEGGLPEFGPCKLLDYELEVGFFVAEGNSLGERITLSDAHSRLFGFCIVNDWSARDMQKWEYQPLGPFLAKSFATTLSPWVVTTQALAPFQCAAFERPETDPQPISYLSDAQDKEAGLFDIQLTVSLQSEKMRADNMDAVSLSKGSFRDMYWTPSQMVTHHTVNGCNLNPGDLLASGTVSGKDRSARGCLLELTWDGEIGNAVPGTQRTPLVLPTGEERRFLADGDRVDMNGFCEADGFRRIGFGVSSGTILSAS